MHTLDPRTPDNRPAVEPDENDREREAGNRPDGWKGDEGNEGEVRRDAASEPIEEGGPADETRPN